MNGQPSATPTNATSVDNYDGNGGIDTLRLVFTDAEWARADIQADLQAYRNWLATHNNPNSATGQTFSFTAFNLQVRNWERLQIEHAVADTATVKEDTAPNPVLGNVLANDVLIDGISGAAITDTGRIVSAVNGTAANVGTAIAGTYGTLTLNANGTYSFALNNSSPAVQALAEGQTITQTFQYTMRDGALGESVATLTITIQGSNDGPIAVADTNAGDAVIESGVNRGQHAVAGDASASGNVLEQRHRRGHGRHRTVALSTVSPPMSGRS